jgi:uncharacterized protein (UPF0303 family)
MDIESLEAEAPGLILPRFDEATALELGLILLDLAKGKPVVLDIRNANRSYFHAALPGSQANNDNWARRKSNIALLNGAASMLVMLKLNARNRSLQMEGLSEADYALSGGAVPVMVAGTGMVAVATASGLPQEDDHRLIVEAIRALKDRLG